MLYVYSFYNYEEEYEELSAVLDKIKEFKPFGDGFRYISDRDDIVIEGKEPLVTPLHELLDGYFDGGDVLEIGSDLLDSKMEIPKLRAIELLYDDLRIDGNYHFTQRIWDADNVYGEIEKIIKELTVVVVGMIIDELNSEYERIKEGNFEWV